MHKILYFAHGDERLYGMLRPFVPPGCELVTLEANSDEERLDKIRSAEVVVLAGRFLERRFVQAAQKLRLVNFQGVGYHDAADMHALAERGIAYAYAPGGTAEGVSEHTILLMLATYKRLAFLDSEIRRGAWHDHAFRSQSRQLFGKTIGILGLGRVGKAVAERLGSFGAQLIYNDILEMPADLEQRLGVTRVSFDELLRRSDVLTLHVPLLETTHHLLDDDAIGRMKPGAILINCARGPVVHEPALLRALESGHLSGAGLDVREIEPPPQPDPFARLANVVMSPHVAPGTIDAMNMKMADVFENVRRLFAGEPLLHVVT